jgi:Calx-beta domain.
MKSLIRIFSIAAAVAFVAACDPNKTPVFDDSDAFAAFDTDYMSVGETAGTISIPVTIASITPVQTSVTYAVVADESGKGAVEGKNFSFADNSGVLTFDGKERTKTIDIDIKALSGVYTGDLSFTIELKSAGKINLGAEKTCKINIEDLDHPLADVLGTYTVTCTDYYDGPTTYTMTLSKDPEELDIVWCNAICPACAQYVNYGPWDVWGRVSEDHKTITFALGQKPGAQWGYGDLVFCTWAVSSNGNFDVFEEGQAVFTKQADGVYMSEDKLCFVDQYVWSGALLLGKADGKNIVWTKK